MIKPESVGVKRVTICMLYIHIRQQVVDLAPSIIAAGHESQRSHDLEEGPTAQAAS